MWHHCARPLDRMAPASMAASGTYTSTVSCKTSGRCPCKQASCLAVSHATRRCVPMARAGPAVSQASPASVRKDGRGPSVTSGPMTLVLEINVYTAPACPSMHFPTAVSAWRVMEESCVMRRKICSTPARQSSASTASAGSLDSGSPTVSAAVATSVTAVIEKSPVEGSE